MGLLHQLLPSATSVVGLHFPYPPGTVTELPEVEDAAYVGASPLFFSRATKIVGQAARLAIPAVYWRRELADAGGLMSYGTDAKESYRVLGDYAGRILKGEKAGDLPVQQSTRFELVINLKTAKALRLAVPPTLIALADEIIE